MRILAPVFAVVISAHGALAEPSGDPARGATFFGDLCTACHSLRDEDGVAIAGRRARSGPNLFGVADGPIASDPDFRYGSSILQLGENGQVWDEARFVGYVANPTGWLREALEDPRARGKMAYRLDDASQARDIYAYLASLRAQ